MLLAVGSQRDAGRRRFDDGQRVEGAESVETEDGDSRIRRRGRDDDGDVESLCRYLRGGALRPDAHHAGVVGFVPENDARCGLPQHVAARGLYAVLTDRSGLHALHTETNVGRGRECHLGHLVVGVREGDRAVPGAERAGE